MRPLVPVALVLVAVAAAGCATTDAGTPPSPESSGRREDSPEAAASAGDSNGEAEATSPDAAPGTAGAPGFHRRGPSARLIAPAPKPTGLEFEKGTPKGSKKREWFPPGPMLYDPYLAAPRQSRTAVKALFPIGGKSTHPAFENTLGFNKSAVRWTTEEHPGVATEVQLEAAVFARFDRHDRWDMDASDWRFGFPIAHRDGDIAWKIHLYHLTSHLGDEYIVRNSPKNGPLVQPLDYHLEEAAFGLSWDASEGSRVYGEAGTAVYTSGPTDNGRVQAGYEWVGQKACSGLAPFFAVDLQSRHDQDWIPGKTAAVGVAYGRHIRLGVEFYHGRDTQTQFQKEQLRYVALGISMDF